MTYTVKRLAPGSYDVLLGEALIASLVRDVHGDGPADTWIAELLDEMPASERPEPFANQKHAFTSRAAALEWLGIQEKDAAEPVE